MDEFLFYSDDVKGYSKVCLLGVYLKKKSLRFSSFLYDDSYKNHKIFRAF